MYVLIFQLVSIHQWMKASTKLVDAQLNQAMWTVTSDLKSTPTKLLPVLSHITLPHVHRGPQSLNWARTDDHEARAADSTREVAEPIKSSSKSGKQFWSRAKAREIVAFNDPRGMLASRSTSEMGTYKRKQIISDATQKNASPMHRTQVR